MRPHRSRTLVPALLLAVPGALGALGAAQSVKTAQAFGPAGQSRTDVEFVAPMPAEEVPNAHPTSPNPDSWTIQLEIALDQRGQPQTGILEGVYLPSPGAAAPLPTDVNGDGLPGDPHPAIPALVLTMDDSLAFNGFPLPPGTNLASFFELIGSEIEHGGGQSTTCTWVLTPLAYAIFDLNGDLGTNLTATINGKADTVFVRHGLDPLYLGPLSVQNPTITITTADWISTVDSSTPPGAETPFLVCVEVRIPCWFDPSTIPPTPVPLDPVFGPCQGGNMACTGNWPAMPGPGFHPMFPSLDVRFSDDFIDLQTGTFVPGGVITGGQCGVIWGSTGASVAYAFRQSSVHAWYGVNGVPDTTPLGGGDDQLIYRFVMPVVGDILDTDVLPQEMLITAAVETASNCFSITNLRVKHRPDVVTRDP